MSRYSRMQSTNDNWVPANGTMRVECAPSVLREARLACAGPNGFGTIYGTRQGDTIHLISNRGRAGLERLGVFASSLQNLEHLGNLEASVALVIDGKNEAFLVRQGSPGVEPQTRPTLSSISPPTPPVASRKGIRPLVACLLLALLPLSYALARRQPPPLSVEIHEQAGQMRISWNIPTQSTLIIIDGQENRLVPITPAFSTITYARRSGDVEVQLGSAYARFVGPPPPPPEKEQIRRNMAELRKQIVSLNASKTTSRARLGNLWVRTHPNQ